MLSQEQHHTSCPSWEQCWHVSYQELDLYLRTAPGLRVALENVPKLVGLFLNHGTH